MNDIRRVLSYNDVLLVPRNSELDHISDADINFKYDNIPQPFSAPPVINSPMDKVCSVTLLNRLGFIFNMPVSVHRWFDSAEDQIAFFEKCGVQDESKVFISVGILDKWQEWIDALIQYRGEKHTFGFLLDIANGDTKAGVCTVKYLRYNCPNANIMAGNVATRSGFGRLQDVGANFIRCGIGAGSICSTRINTGMGVPTLTTILDCQRVKDTAYLVADGGIEYPGDICKAIAAGSDMVMLGKLLAATSLSGGEKLDKDFKPAKKKDQYVWVQYSGMASKEAIQKLNSKKSSFSIEGVSGYIPYTGETEEVVTNMLGNLRASVSYYAGCRSWDEFRRKVKFIEITNQGWEESRTRIKV